MIKEALIVCNLLIRVKNHLIFITYLETSLYPNPHILPIGQIELGDRRLASPSGAIFVRVSKVENVVVVERRWANVVVTGEREPVGVGAVPSDLKRPISCEGAG